MVEHGMARWLMVDFGGDLESPMPAPPDWFARAACGDQDPSLWFPAKGETSAAAKAICGRCRVRELCLDYALEVLDVAGGDDPATRNRHGILGGKSPRERTAMAKAGEGPFTAEAAASPLRRAGDAERGERLIAEAVRGGVPVA